MPEQSNPPDSSPRRARSRVPTSSAPGAASGARGCVRRVRVSRAFRFGSRRITPLVEVFNLGNADTITGYTTTVGSAYLRPADILAPRIVRFGVTVDF